MVVFTCLIDPLSGLLGVGIPVLEDEARAGFVLLFNPCFAKR